MRKLAPLLVTLALALIALPAVGGAAPVDTTPYGLEDNPLGTIRWLPPTANEKAPSGQFRLTVVYDFSINATGGQAPLLVKGPFGVKFFSPSPDVSMAGHSPSVSSLGNENPNLAPADPAFMGVAGDVRDGACSKAGTSAFSKAYTATRSFFHPGEAPYPAVSAPGKCEVVDASTAVTDGQGNLTGYQTTVTTHVPGFWIDVTWPTRTFPAQPSLGRGRVAAEVWYGSFFDTGGDTGEWYAVGDTTGQSTSVGSPGDYDFFFQVEAHPVGAGPSCQNLGPQDIDGTWDDVKFTVPASATKVAIKLFPKGDWDLVVFDPEGSWANSGYFGGFEEVVTIPSSSGDFTTIPELVPGEFTIRACNFTGEATTFGGVIID